MQWPYDIRSPIARCPCTCETGIFLIVSASEVRIIQRQNDERYETDELKHWMMFLLCRWACDYAMIFKLLWLFGCLAVVAWHKINIRYIIKFSVFALAVPTSTSERAVINRWIRHASSRLFYYDCVLLSLSTCTKSTLQPYYTGFSIFYVH